MTPKDLSTNNPLADFLISQIPKREREFLLKMNESHFIKEKGLVLSTPYVEGEAPKERDAIKITVTLQDGMIKL